MKHPTY
jgi:hypothetical protein